MVKSNPSKTSAKRKPDTMMIPILWGLDVKGIGEITPSKIWGKKVGAFFIHHDFVAGVDLRSIVQQRDLPLVVTHVPTGRRVLGDFATMSQVIEFVKRIRGLTDWSAVTGPQLDPKLKAKIERLGEKVKRGS